VSRGHREPSDCTDTRHDEPREAIIAQVVPRLRWNCFKRGHYHNECKAPPVAGCCACNTADHNAAN
jgi:hypothetical protein